MGSDRETRSRPRAARLAGAAAALALVAGFVALSVRARRPTQPLPSAADAGQDAQRGTEAPGASLPRRPLEELVRGDYRFVAPDLDALDLTGLPESGVPGGDEAEPFLVPYWQLFVAGPGEYRNDDVRAWLRCTRSSSGERSCQPMRLVLRPETLSELGALGAPPATAPPLTTPAARVTIHVATWNDAVEKALGALDPARYCLSIDPSELSKGPTARLPLDLQCLFAEEYGTDGGEGRSLLEPYLRPLRALRYLSIDGWERRPLDLRFIAQNRDLRYLRLGYGNLVEQPAALGALADLRFLDLRHVEGLEQLDFATRLRELRRVYLDGTRIRSLAPLAQLPHLRRVHADLTPLTGLPAAGWPALDELHVLCLELPSAATEAFAAHHPRVTVWHRWSRSLTRAFEGVTRVRVVGEQTFDVTDPAEIQRLAREHLAIDDARTDWACRCDGDPKLELYRGEVRVARLAAHHGIALAWPAWFTSATRRCRSGAQSVTSARATSKPPPCSPRSRTCRPRARSQRGARWRATTPTTC
jgi:hypothetical protein